ncbi:MULTISPECIES: VOC family protein [Nocardia]|uniref:VOC family protein n=1 Tax=Nocardia TaxID=1817 RepID=UPI000D68D730|nr:MULTISPECIES: VOC family protein [Nocardia]
MVDEHLSGSRASVAVESLGWRFLLGSLAATVAVPSLRCGLDIADAAARACADDADEHLRIDVRGDRVELVLQPRTTGRVLERDVVLAHRISESVSALGFEIALPRREGPGRAVQAMEIAIDTEDRTVIRPFWKAVLAYVDAPGTGDPNAIVDPVGQGPALWFQHMDEPRPQRNRIHLDISVPHDEADRRIRAALEAGGTMISDAAARAFWVLADAEGNEVCVCTWQDRD